MRRRPLRSVFRDIVLLASAVPLAACASVVYPDYGDGGDARPDGDAPIVNTCSPRAEGMSCSSAEIWPCGLPIAVMQPSFLTGSQCDTLCPDFVRDSAFYSHSCSVQGPQSNGEARVNCVLCRGGRRPDGWRPEEPIADDAVGAYFARLAELEAASIPAFRMLADDLARFGAPAHLLEAVRAAIADERVHARLARDLAKRFGGQPRAPRVSKKHADSIEAIAMLNATEGLVGEAFGGLVATYQSMHAVDAEVRAVMARIADDESRHAELALEVASWAEEQLDHDARVRVTHARNAALDELRAEVSAEFDDVLVGVVGFPSAEMRARLLDRFAEHVCAAA
jgi:hypothetical protein